MGMIILPDEWDRQPAYQPRLAPPFQRIPFAVNLVDGVIPQNLGYKGQLAVTLSGTNITEANGEGIGIKNGSGGIQFGSSGAFNAWSAANSPAWIAWVFKHGSYVDNGSSANVIWSYGNASAAAGFFAQVASTQILSVRLANTFLTGPTLVNGQTYRCVAGRDGSGNCWLWINGRLITSGTGATASVSRQLCLLRDEATTRWYQGSLNMLAFGSENPASFGASLSKNPWKIFSRPGGPPLISAGGAAAQELTPSLFSNTQAFYAPTVSHVLPQASRFDNTQSFPAAQIDQTLPQDSRFDNAQSFPAATVSHVLPQASRLDNGQTFYAPTVTPGEVILEPGLFSDGDTFYSAQIDLGLSQASRFDNAQTFYGPQVDLALVQASRFDNAQAFYDPTVTPGEVALTPDRFDNTNTFYEHVLGQKLEPDLFTNGNTFYGPQINLELSQSSRFDNAQSFPAAQVDLILVQDARFDNAASFFAPTVSHLLQAGLFSNTSEFFSATVTPGEVSLEPSLVSDADTFFSATVSHGLEADLFQNDNTFFAPQIDQTILPETFENSEVFFSARVDHGLTAGLFENTNTFFEAEIDQSTRLIQDDRFDNENEVFAHVATASNDLVVGLVANTNQFFGSVITQTSGPATISGTSVDRLAEIWARLGMDSTRPVANTPTQIAFGDITQTASPAGSERTGPPIFATEDSDTMVEEIWQRLGLDSSGPLVQTATTLEFGAVQCTVTTVGSTVTVTRQ